MDISTLQLPSTLGDYTLESLYSFTEVTATYVATQSLIKRQVLLTVLTAPAEDKTLVEWFIESVRRKTTHAKARLCAVYEAMMTEDGVPYYTEELPVGHQLEKWIQADKKMDSLLLTKVIALIAKMECSAQQNNFSMQAWSMSDVFVSNKGEIHLRNLVQMGEWSQAQAQSDLLNVASIIPALIKPGASGMNRLLTLSKWMQGGTGAPTGMDWAQVQELSETVISQLESNATFATAAPGKVRNARKSNGVPVFVWILLVFLLVGSAVGAYMMLLDKPQDTPTQNAKPELILLSDDAWPDRSEMMMSYLDNESGKMKELSVDKHEVTIASYQNFLNFFNKLTERERKHFRHPDQPNEKKSHEPDQWHEIQEAIITGNPWKGQVITKRHPVTNIDYWDAVVYCMWLGRRLPEFEEWQVIVDAGASSDADEGYSAVDQYINDVSKQGVSGLNGGVSEWTNSKAVNPEIPMGGRKNIIVGGSFLKPGKARNEEYVNSPMLRRFDVGFRTVK